MGSNDTLLLVEDEAYIRLSLERALIDSGFSVVTAVNGGDAIGQLNSPNNNLSGLITDIYLGEGRNGWDVARRARELDASFPVVYVTSDSPEEWASQGVPNSALITKPFAEVQVITAIANLLNAASETRQR